ncbi:hypothetical protein NC651_004355 [Populus alba x Populus x berolinensis]|nr:hypothetical protein NC651_004355 [Populus alba x Populus x berolinensis]
MDHVRARDDPDVVKKVPYYKANRIVLETEEEKRLSMM